MAHTLCSFNANNLFVRYRFEQTFPGDLTGKSAVTDPEQGYLPMYDEDLFELFNADQRDLAARAITRDGERFPDIICLQEVESLIALLDSQLPATAPRGETIRAPKSDFATATSTKEAPRGRPV